MTSFNPDHTSVTAQTFTSTRPMASASARTTSSVMSVATLAVRLGQEIQIMPAGWMAALNPGSAARILAASVKKAWTRSRSRPASRSEPVRSTPAKSSAWASQARSPGRWTKAAFWPGLKPSFFGSGAPE
jgi:hypothetical protein